MKNKIYLIIFILLAQAFSFFPLITEAATCSGSGGTCVSSNACRSTSTIEATGCGSNETCCAIVPCGNGSEYADRCTLCHLVVGFDGLIDYGFKIFIFVALLSITASGIFYIVSTGNQEMMGKAKGVIVNTLFGFAFVLLAWLIVNVTISVLGVDMGLIKPGKTWGSFECDSNPSSGATVTF
jgi:hypothetical protein